MAEFVLTKMDAEPHQRTWSTGHFTVRKDNRGTAVFLFDYPESTLKINSTEAEALAAAKSFMAIDDLVAALRGAIAEIESLDGRDNSSDPENDLSYYTSALEKAGIK